MASVGISTSQTCGVRDYAALQAEELSRQTIPCSVHWLLRTDGSIAAARAEIGVWTRGLLAELERERPDALLLHYSVFSYSYRGLPLFVHPTLRALRSSGVPLVTVLHEYAYPWRRDGARGSAWAITQRALLLDVMRASSAVVVTAPARAEWLTSRSWLPRRATVVAPVFSNLPAPMAGSRSVQGARVIGLFGYSYPEAAVALVLDAMRLLQDRGLAVQLTLLGAPGRSSATGETWLELARIRGLVSVPSFTGKLAAQDLSNALAACDVLLFADPSGPTGRKTTLAASLASGSPVVALHGRRSWSELVESGAAMVVEQAPSALADALGALLGDERLRASLAARGGEFAQRRMSLARSAEVVGQLLEDVLSSSAS